MEMVSPAKQGKQRSCRQKLKYFFSYEVNMINDDVLNMINDDYYIIIRGHPLKEDPRTSMDASRTSMENAYINIIK